MNSPQTNEKILEKLEKSKDIYHDDPDTAQQSKIDEVTAEAPWAFGRKIAGWLCVGVWIFSVLMLFSGAMEMSIVIPMVLWALAAVCITNIPRFIFNKKLFDMVICTVAGAVCVIVGVIVLFAGSITIPG